MKEVIRKLFHMLSLAYLAAYHVIGWPAVKWWLAAWVLFVTAIEVSRFVFPAVKRFLDGLFAGMIRESELHSFSGIFHTSLGSLGVVLLAGDRPVIVTAALLYLALGDAAAALVGKTWGRRKILGGRKSLEGCLANFATCLLCGAALRLPLAAVAAGAVTATAVELVPNNRYWNDNLWLPVLSAGALLCAA